MDCWPERASQSWFYGYLTRVRLDFYRMQGTMAGVAEDELFGHDPIDVYSEPVSKRATLLAEVFALPLRRNAAKSDRSLGVLWDRRRPLVSGFDNCYSYVVRFDGRGSVAGNHYHLEKDEVFHAITGAFRVVLENIESKQREELTLRARDNSFVFVRRPVAHAIQALTPDAILVTLASHPNVEADSYAYRLVSPALTE
jgi:hypothetical protein